MRSYSFGFLVLMLGIASGCGSQSTAPRAALSPGAAVPGTYLLGDELEAALPAPGEEANAAGEIDRGLALAAAGSSTPSRSLGEESNPCVRWNQLTRSLAATARLPPPLFARAYALVSVACADGITAGARGNRASTPAGCIVGGAASEVLLDLFPGDRAAITAALAEEAALAAGEGRGAVLRGLALGRAAGRVAVRYGHRDGSSVAPSFVAIPPGEGIWNGTNPVLPACGSWRTWIVTSGTEFRPEPPYPFGSAEDLADVAAVVAAAAARTPEQVAIVHKWADASPPAIWNALLNERIVSHGLSPAAASRAHAFLNMALEDAFISCWATKYEYWTARPFQRIPGLVTVVPTPNFPSYTSGHSTISAAAAAVLGEIFPDEAPWFRGQAEEAALSRLYAGIHFPHDNDQGLVVGHLIGGRAVSAMRVDQARTEALAARE